MGITATEFEAAYRAHGSMVLRWATRIMRDPHAGEDAAQEAWASAWQYRESYNGSRAIGSWLIMILKRVCWAIMNPEKAKRKIPIHTVSADSMSTKSWEEIEPYTEASQDAYIDAGRLHHAVDCMTVPTGRGGVASKPASPATIETARLALLGWTSKEISEHRGVSHQSVDGTMARVVAALRRTWGLDK